MSILKSQKLLFLPCEVEGFVDEPLLLLGDSFDNVDSPEMGFLDVEDCVEDDKAWDLELSPVPTIDFCCSETFELFFRPLWSFLFDLTLIFIVDFPFDFKACLLFVLTLLETFLERLFAPFDADILWTLDLESLADFTDDLLVVSLFFDFIDDLLVSFFDTFLSTLLPFDLALPSFPVNDKKVIYMVEDKTSTSPTFVLKTFYAGLFHGQNLKKLGAKQNNESRTCHKHTNSD